MRQILYAGLGLSSGSVYPNDLETNLDLMAACGHVEFRRVADKQGGDLILNPYNIITKTHELPSGNERSLCIVRDGRAAYVSIWKFYEGQRSLQDIVNGNSAFGLWSDHVMAWTSGKNVVDVIRFEDLIDNPNFIINRLSRIFGNPHSDPETPFKNRDLMAEKDGKWIAKHSDWRDSWPSELEELFWSKNHRAMKLVYPTELPK